MRRSLTLALSGAAAMVVVAAGIAGCTTTSPHAALSLKATTAHLPASPTAHSPGVKTAPSPPAHPPAAPTAHSPASPTALSIKVWKNAITSGQQVTISGQLIAGSTPLAGQVVFLYRVAGGKLYQVGRAQLTSQTGKPWFTVQPKATTEYELVFPGTKALAPSHSGGLTLTVG